MFAGPSFAVSYLRVSCDVSALPIALLNLQSTCAVTVLSLGMYDRILDTKSKKTTFYKTVIILYFHFCFKQIISYNRWNIKNIGHRYYSVRIQHPSQRKLFFLEKYFRLLRLLIRLTYSHVQLDCQSLQTKCFMDFFVTSGETEKYVPQNYVNCFMFEQAKLNQRLIILTTLLTFSMYDLSLMDKNTHKIHNKIMQYLE